MRTENANAPNINTKTLLDRIFIGEYQEKRYVNKLNVYKDLVVLNQQEKILCDDLSKVKNQISFENPNTWFGYTEPTDVGAPPVFCLWTTFDDDQSAIRNAIPKAASVVFGEYWFQIKAIRFGVNTIEISLKILRPVEQNAPIPTASVFSTIAQQALEIDTNKIQQYVQENIIEVDWISLFKRWKDAFNQKAYQFFSNEVTWSNFIYCIQLFGLLCIASIKMSIQFIHYLGEFTLKLIFELTKLIHTVTPIVLAIINLLTKMIGGLYILLAMIWRDLFHGDSQKNNRKNNYGNNNRPAITYRDYPRTFQQYRRTSTSSKYHSNK